MRGEDEQQNHMFSYLSPEKRVRKDHPLRAIRSMVVEVLAQLSRRFDAMYARVGFHVHYTPTYASWLNQVEIWFNRITQQAIRSGTFRSVKELVENIDRYVQSSNAHAQPFVWTTTADSILAKVHDYANVFPGRNTRRPDICTRLPSTAAVEERSCKRDGIR